MNVDQFENTAAWLQYCDGMSQFHAETEAARRQGILRAEALKHVENSKRDIARCGHIGSADARKSENAMPRVQPHAAQKG